MGCAQSAALSADAAHEIVLTKDAAKSEVCVGVPFTEGRQSDYRLLGKIGQGAYATVHLAKDSRGSTVAVKVTDLRQPESREWEVPVTSGQRRHAIKQEVSAMMRVAGKDNIVQLLGSFEEGALSFVVMEKCDGTLLQAINRLPSITERSLCRIFRDMLSGMGAAHAAGLVHRDIKPDNFLCAGPADTIKLCDFGLAGVLRPETPGLKGVFGTPPFMCPEMLLGKPYGTMADTWSFGVIVYSMFYGRFPYEPATRSGEAMKDAIRTGLSPPTFQASAQVTDARKVSAPAREFVAGLLCRSPLSRLSTEAALEHRFFKSPGKGNVEPALKASMRYGAFCTVQRFSPSLKNEVDHRIEALQATRMSGAPRPSAPSPGSCEKVKCHDDDLSTNIASEDATTVAHTGLMSPASLLNSFDRFEHEEH